MMQDDREESVTADLERRGELAIKAVTSVMGAVMDQMSAQFIVAVCGASTAQVFDWMAEGGLPQDIWEAYRDRLAAGISAMSYAAANGSAEEVH